MVNLGHQTPCGCWRCLAGQNRVKMIVCPDCGFKRCPKASDHVLACTGSNEPGQLGSVYTVVDLTTDPMEKIVADALDRAGIRYVTENHNRAKLDFYLVDHDLYIEVKQFHTARLAIQTSRVPDVIVIQGVKAAEWFAKNLAANQ